MPPETCPNCGADVPRNARACPECGSDEKTGWSEQAAYDHLDLPDDSFDYNEFVEREFSGHEPRPRGWFLWAVIAIVLCFLLVWGIIL